MPIDHFKKLGKKKTQVWKNSKVGSSKYKQNKRIKKIKKRAKLFKPTLSRTYHRKSKKSLFPKRLSLQVGKKSTTKKYSSKRNKLLNQLLTKKLLTFGVIVLLIGIIFVSGVFAWYSKDLPDPNKIIDRTIAQSTKIYDRTGEKILYDIHGNERRTLIDIDELPEHVINATIAMEDRSFYEHSGISIWGIIRGQIVPRLRGRRAQGGSTLTQQFVKNAVLTNERSIGRKIKEWILSYQIEKKYSKREILSMYFNEIPYGSVAYGVESAANIYFDKSAKDLTIAESAILAALPQAPTYYSPYGSHQDALIGRQQYIIDLMAEQGYITEEESKLAKQEKLEFAQQRNNISAPHFVFYVREQLDAILGERFVEQAGLKVITTLDWEKQEIAENIIKERTETYPETYNAHNAALLSLDVESGDILTMVGSRNFFDEEIDGQVNVTLAKRQPGSSIKPFIYTLAFKKGYQPESILFDVETLFKTDSDDYEPVNYDLETRGPVSLRKALAGSLNIPAVKLMYLVGIEDTLKLLKDFGYTTIQKAKDYGLSLVLGGLEVKIIEHTNSFATLARKGIKKPTRSILRVEDAQGKVLYEVEKEKGKRVIDENIVIKTNNILSDNNARSYVFGENNYLTLGERPVAAKTGTTNDFNDAWTIGFTPHIVTSVWIGNNNNEKMVKGAAGGALAAPIWRNFMQEVTKNHPLTGFASYEPDKSIEKPMLNGQMAQQTKVKIDTMTGLLATDYTPPTTIQEKIFYKVHSILHYLDKNDPLGLIPNSLESDPNYETWEEAVLKWVTEDAGQEIDTSDPPTEYDHIHTLAKKPTLVINYPLTNQEISSNNMNIQATAQAKTGSIDRVAYYIDNKFIGTSKSNPHQYNYNFSPLFSNGHHELKVIAFDQQENFQEIKVPFTTNIHRTTTYSLNWIKPQENAVIKQDDFPLNIQISIDQINLINKIDFYYIDETTGKSTWIQTISNPLYSSIDVDWETAPAVANYVLHTIITDFENNIHQGPGINITIE